MTMAQWLREEDEKERSEYCRGIRRHMSGRILNKFRHRGIDVKLRGGKESKMYPTSELLTIKHKKRKEEHLLKALLALA